MPEDTPTIAMTYADLAQRLSIKPASAKRLAQRRKWHRVIGNDGVAIVHVPVDAVPNDVAPDVIRDITDDVTNDIIPEVSPPVTPDLTREIAHLEGLVEGLRGQAEADRRRADAADKRADAAERRADAAEARVLDIAADRDAWKRQGQRSLWARWFGGSTD